MSISSSNQETYLHTPSSMLLSPSSSPSYQETSDLIVRIELRRNDNGKTVGIYAERLVDREPLSLDKIKDNWDQYQEKQSHIFQNLLECKIGVIFRPLFLNFEIGNCRCVSFEISFCIRQ